jgi:hypothetical protein
LSLESGQFTHGVATIFYLLEKARDASFAGEGVEHLIGVFVVAPVDDNVVRRAVALRPGLISRMACVS